MREPQNNASEMLASPEATRGGAWGPLAVWTAMAAAFAGAFWNNFGEMWLRWYPAWKRTHLGLYDRLIGGESYYSHGPLVPLVSVFIIMMLIRKTKVPLRPRPGLGFAVLALSILLHLVSSLARVNFASCFAMMGMLAGLVLVLWGAQALRRLWFPLAFLAFMVPLPEVSIAGLNFRLKMLATDIGVAAADFLGVILSRAGNRVVIAGATLGAEPKTLIIANVCNGLRTLITVIGFGALYAYVCRLRGARRIVLFAMSVPVALVANSIRIVGLIVVADIWTVEIATGWFHDVSGAMIFVLAFIMMFGIERVLLWGKAAGPEPKLFVDVRRGPEDEGQGRRLFAASASPRGIATVALLVLTAVGALWLGRATPAGTGSGAVRRAVPVTLTVDDATWTGYDMPLDEQTLTILETPDYMNRHYVAPGRPAVDVSVIFSKDNRKGTHPPDLCLEGSGGGIVAKGRVVARHIGERGDIECAEIIVQYGSARQYYLYFYKCGDRYTPSFWKQQLVIFTNGILNRNAAGALVRFSTRVDPDEAAARERVLAFVRATVPYLDASLP